MSRSPFCQWTALRRAHSTLLLTALVVLWGFFATSIFMSNASSFPPEAVEAPRSLGVARDGGIFLRTAPRPSADQPQPRLDPAQLPELQRMLRMRATALSKAQSAAYAASLQEALRQLEAAQRAPASSSVAKPPLEGAAPAHGRQAAEAGAHGAPGAEPEAPEAPEGAKPGAAAQEPETHDPGEERHEPEVHDAVVPFENQPAADGSESPGEEEGEEPGDGRES